ncbi:MAG: hypothetical protein NXI24_12300 [bacterium]|nr:hypothetical protein [bacterium]
MRQCETLLRKHPRNASLLSLAGSAAYGLKRYSDAAGFLERATELRPESKALQNALERVRRKL